MMNIATAEMRDKENELKMFGVELLEKELIELEKINCLMNTIYCSYLNDSRDKMVNNLDTILVLFTIAQSLINSQYKNLRHLIDEFHIKECCC